MLQKPNFKKAKKQNKMTTEMMSEVSKAINNISACRIVDYKMNPDIVSHLQLTCNTDDHNTVCRIFV